MCNGYFAAYVNINSPYWYLVKLQYRIIVSYSCKIIRTTRVTTCSTSWLDIEIYEA